MTKAYLKFPKQGRCYLPKIVSRRFNMQDFLYVAYRSDESPDDPDGSKRAALIVEFQKMIDKSLESRATKEELNKIKKDQIECLKDVNIDSLREMLNDKTGVMSKLIQQGLDLQKIETRMSKMQSERPVNMSTRGQIKSWLQQKVSKDSDITVEMEIRQAKLDNRRPNIPIMELRVASPMLFSTVNGGSSPYIGSFEIEPGVNEIVRARPVFWDYITKGRTNSNTYVWVNKTNPLGAAAFIGPGVPKPGISLELKAEISVSKKIAVSAKAGTEVLQDIDGMTTFIEQELRYQLNIEANSKLMTGVNSSTVPAGVQTLSVAFTQTGIATTNPNYMDAIRAVIGQLRSGWLQGAITFFINSVDSTNMDLSKASSSGVYMLPPFVTSDGRTISGATIVEDNNVPVGHFQAAMLQYYRILIYKDFMVTWGWENDDFTKNLVTAVAEMRIHQFFNDQYTGAFVYDTFANVQTAITAV